jgi:hypothetical protein
VQFSERGQRVAECDALRHDSPVFALVIPQNDESVFDCVFRLFDALSQPHSVGLKQRDVKEFAPVSGIDCGHDHRLNEGRYRHDAKSNCQIGRVLLWQPTIAVSRPSSVFCNTETKKAMV